MQEVKRVLAVCSDRFVKN